MSNPAEQGMELAAGPLRLERGAWHREVLKPVFNTDGAIADLVEKWVKKEAVAVVWNINEVFWGRVSGGKAVFAGGRQPDKEFFLEARFFNDEEELHIRRDGGRLRGRYIRDGIGADVSYVDSFSRFFGEETEACLSIPGDAAPVPEDGYVMLEDRDRKIVMQLPAEKGCGWYGLRTRNYVEASAVTGQAGYTDYRLVAVESAKGGR